MPPSYCTFVGTGTRKEMDYDIRTYKYEECDEISDHDGFELAEIYGSEGSPMMRKTKPSRGDSEAEGVRPLSIVAIFALYVFIAIAILGLVCYDPLDISTTTLLRNLADLSSEPLNKRSVSECDVVPAILSDYSLPWHVGALFIILFISTTACLIPLLATHIPKLHTPRSFLFSARHFGTGVLLATAFCHLLPTAFINLSDPCLSSFWTEKYPAMPGLIAMVAVFLVALIEMVFSPRRLEESESHNIEERRSEDSGEALVLQRRHKRRDVLQCVLLEMGILFHSIFIGMAISTSVGKEFVVLLIAITFHQTFEGLALGARIAALEWEEETIKPWLMCLAYGLTTPLGQALGLATHTLYSPASQTGLLMVGIMNAISAGLLTYASIAELLHPDLLSDESWRILKGRRRVAACILVLLGAGGMAAVGAWA